jgi:Uma2 family endonuclease
MKTAKTTNAIGVALNGLPSPLERLCPWLNDPVLRRLQPKGMPQLFGDEDLEMGESTIHTLTVGILLYGLGFHLASQAAFRVFGNMNLYYSDDPMDYVSPDVMVVRPPRPLPAQLSSYRVGEQGPAPLLVAEVLSFRTWQEGDMDRKPVRYSALGVKEYIVADVTGEMLEQRLLLLRRTRDGSWRDEQDRDGGITSRLGFRIVTEADGQLRLLDAKTGKRYARPEEAQAEADRARALEKEVTSLRAQLAKESKVKSHRRKS